MEQYEPTQAELDLLHSQVPGHHWDCWRRLTGTEDYYAACSCGWRSSDAGHVSPALGQVKDHLNAVRRSLGWGPVAEPPARDERERAHELFASVESQQERLAETVGHFGDLLAANEEQADRRVAALERAAASAAREQTTAAIRRAEALQRRLERAKELRRGIVSAAAALAVVAEEIAWIHQDLETRHPSGTAEHRRLVHEAGRSAASAREIERTFRD